MIIIIYLNSRLTKLSWAVYKYVPPGFALELEVTYLIWTQANDLERRLELEH
jgi:hypothetical protein